MWCFLLKTLNDLKRKNISEFKHIYNSIKLFKCSDKKCICTMKNKECIKTLANTYYTMNVKQSFYANLFQHILRLLHLRDHHKQQKTLLPYLQPVTVSACAHPPYLTRVKELRNSLKQVA